MKANLLVWDRAKKRPQTIVADSDGTFCTLSYGEVEWEKYRALTTKEVTQELGEGITYSHLAKGCLVWIDPSAE